MKLFDRLKEPSTWAGVGAVVAAAPYAAQGGDAQWFIGTIAASIAAVLLKEGK